jgi:hypothetical protein
MKKYLLLTFGLAAMTVAMAQDYKVAKSTGKLVINLSSVTVEGYAGNEIIFSSENLSKHEDDRAKGLRPINGSGVTDNTGLGIAVTDKGNTVEVSQVNQRDRRIRIKVPKGVSISYEFERVEAGRANFKNIESELEVSVQYNSVTLENVTGPMTIKTIYGGIDAKLGDVLKGPISIASVYGHVDVAVPVATKANVVLSTSHGEIFAAADFKIDVEKNNSEMINYSNKVRGKLNGGGLDFSLRADYGKIYLRKNN